MVTSLLVSLLVAGLLCWLASMLIPAGTPQTIAYVIIILACLGGFLGFGGVVKAAPTNHAPAAHALH